MIINYFKFCIVILTLLIATPILCAIKDEFDLGTIEERLLQIDKAQDQLSQERMALMEKLSHIESETAVRLILQSLGRVDVITQKAILQDYLVNYDDFAIPVILEFIEEHPRSTPPVSTAVLAIGKIKGEEFLEFVRSYKQQHPHSNAARHLMVWASIDF